MDEVSVNLRFALEKASGCDIMSDGHKVVKDNNRYRCKDMEFKTYEYLAEDAKMIRQIVFMQEQGFVDEFDDTDLQATQIVLYDEGKRKECIYSWKTGSAERIQREKYRGTDVTEGRKSCRTKRRNFHFTSCAVQGSKVL